MNEQRNDFERVRSFIDGAKTGLDWMTSKQGGSVDESEYWRGYRHALDAIGGHVEDIYEEYPDNGKVTP